MIGILSTALLLPLLMGLCSMAMFISLIFLNRPSPLFVVLLPLSFCVLAVYAALRWLPVIGHPAARAQRERYILIIFIIASAAALAIFVFISWRQPNGDWDGWAIWNMRARFIFRSGENWRDSFSPLIAWSHPDYPLLVPLSVVWLWTVIGRETTVAPMLIAAIFSVSTVALLSASIARLRGPTQGLLAGIAILGAPFFIQHGASQYADIPLGFFFLETIVLFALYEQSPGTSPWLLVMSGLTAGLSAWTKNEGLLFCLSVAVARLVAVIPRRGMRPALRETALFIAGLIIPLAMTFYLKIRLVPPGDLLSSQEPSMLMDHLMQPSRYALIMKTFLRTAIQGTRGAAGLPVLLIYFLLLGRKDGKAEPRLGARTASYSISLMLAGYFLVYLVDTYDLQWHLSTSIDRLFIQLWPTFLFWFFLEVRTHRTEL